MRVAIITASIYDKERPTFTKINKKRLEFYCRKHRYDLFYVDRFLTKAKCSRNKYKWQGLYCMMNLMNYGDYDAYVWVDDDIFICNANRKIEDFCRATQKPMIFSRDCNWTSDTTFINMINSGIFILQGQKGRELMNKAWDMRNFTGHGSKFNDQATFNILIINEFMEYCEILSLGELQVMPNSLNKGCNALGIHFVGGAKLSFYDLITCKYINSENNQALVDELLNNIYHNTTAKIMNLGSYWWKIKSGHSKFE